MMRGKREETLRWLEASGLRGRGGAWFETHKKWRAVLAEDGVPFVIGNGGEGEPGSIKDRFVMRTRPDEVVMGLKLAMDTLGAEAGYLYLKGSFHEEERRLKGAIQEKGLTSAIKVHLGDDTYVGGEETALLESIEGRVAWPRPKPPRPASVGLFGRPTLVQNVDTLARVSEALRLGAYFAASDHLTLTIWGDVHSPGAFDVKPGRTVLDVIEREAQGATGGIGWVFPNGAQSLPLSHGQLNEPIDRVTSLLVLDDTTSHHSILGSVARFFELESCGQCPPCVLGTANLRSLVTGDRPQTKRLAPQAALSETASFMSMHGYCSHSRSGAAAVTSLFWLWQTQILEHLRTGITPSGTRERDPFARDSKERGALEAFLRGV